MRPWIADGREGLSAPTSPASASPVKKAKSLYMFLGGLPVFVVTCLLVVCRRSSHPAVVLQRGTLASLELCCTI